MNSFDHSLKYLVGQQFFDDVKDEFKAEGRTEGECKGKADALGRILLRPFHFVDDLLTQRIQAETRIEVLDAWLDEAVLTPDEEGLHHLVEHIKRTPLPTPR